jgi:predicted Zn-ribbon and HTH transcriptional regulator
MAVPKKTINDILNPRVVDKEKYISEDINYLKDIINKKAGVIDMMSPGPLKDELRGTYDPTQESYEEFLQRQSIPQMDRPLTGQAPSDAILETQRIDLNEGGVLGPEGMFRGEDLGTRPLNMANGGLSRTELAEKLGIKTSAIEKAKGDKTRLWQSILKYMDAEKTGQTRPEYYTPKKGVKVNEAVKEIKKFSGTAAQSLPRETYGNVKTNIGQVKDLLNKSKEPLDIRQVKKMLPNLNQETIRTSLNVLKKDPNFKNKIMLIDPATTSSYKVNQDIKKLLSDKRIINVLNSGKFPTDAQIKNVLKTDPTITERRSVDLAETLTGKRDISNFKVPTKYKNISNQYLTDVEKTSSLFGPKKTRARTYYEDELTKTLNLPENIRRLRTNILSKIQNIIPELKGLLAVDEIAGLTSSVRNLSTPYGIFGQVLGKEFNTSVKGFGIDGLKGIYEKKLVGLSPGDPERLRIQKNYNKAVDKFETIANKNNPTKKVKGFKIVFEPPSKAIGNKKIYNQYKDLFDAHYDKYKFSFKVPANTDSLVDISNKLDTPAFQKTVKNRLARLIGKGGKVGALVGLGTLAGTGFALADEPGTESAAETAGTMLAGAGAIGAGYLGGKKLIEKTTGRFAPMIKGAIGKVLQSPFALPFRATGLDRMAMKKLGLLPEDETLAQTYDPRTASGRTTLALEGVAAGAYKPIAERLTSGIKNQTAKSLATGILKLGPRALNLANVLSKAARVTTPLGIASLAGEGIYQFGKKQKEYLESLDPEERKTVEQQYADVAAAEGGIIRKAYKDAGLVEKLGRGAAALDPRNVPYYAAKGLKGLGSGVEMAVKFPVAAGAAIGETIQKGPRKETLTKFGEAVQPSATQYLSEKTGLESLIRKQEKELVEKRPGALAMGDVLELGAEFVAPATGYIKMLEDGSSKLYKVIRDGQAGKKVDPKDIDEVLELLSDKGVERRDFMAVVGGTSALALAKHVGIIDALKILEKTKPVRMLSKSASKMPEWFPSFASRILDDTNSVFKQVDQDLVEITNKNLPDVSVGKYSSGRWEISGYNEYGKPYLIDYEPPSILEDGTKYAGDFSVFDNIPSRMGPDDVEFDSELVESIDDVLGGTSKLEEWTTGVKKKEPTRGEKRVIEAEGRAEADYDAWKESDDFVDE